jgi:ABC-type nitrate/sulfonate/bicarbonate transport system substrate-binding protein
MKRRQFILGLTTAVAVGAAVSACGGDASAGGGAEAKVLKYQGSANAVTFPELAADLGYLGDVTLSWIGNTTSGPQDIQSAATGQTDFGGAFAGAVVKLVEAGAPVTAVVNYYGSDELTFNGYYVLDSSPIRSARDLLGKKIAVNTLGAHHEAVITTYLQKNGLSPDEIKQVQLVVVPPNDTEEAIRRGQVDAGTLGGPLQDRAAAAGGLRRLFTDSEIFGTFAGGPYVFRNDFIAANPNTVRTFSTGVAKAIEWARTTPREEVIARYAKIIQARGRSESTETLQYWKSPGVPARGEIRAEDFTRWEPWLRDSGIISGPLDPGKLFTNEFNGLVTGAAA